MSIAQVRALRALNMRRHGSTLKDIGLTLGVSKERARQLARVGAEVERRMLSTDPWDELPSRIRHALEADECIPTPDGVTVHFQHRDWKRVPAFGILAFDRLNAWLVRHGKEPFK
jgi:hypothetical protein